MTKKTHTIEPQAQSVGARNAKWALCKQIATSNDILGDMVSRLQSGGVVGESRTLKALYLITTSRLLVHPVSLYITGPSAAGKSWTLFKVLELFPADAFHALTKMSPLALVYSKEPLQHRMLILHEQSAVITGDMDYLIRVLQSEGHIRYEVTKPGKGGSEVIEREGPTGVIVTTTRTAINPENLTRAVCVRISDSPKQPRAIMLSLASHRREELSQVEDWKAFQAWLASKGANVEIPFATPLASLVRPDAVRLRRDFGTLLTLIETHAFLHQKNRQRSKSGAIRAKIDDYRQIREIFGKWFSEGVQSSVSSEMRATVEAVSALLKRHSSGVSLIALSSRLKRDKSVVSRRVELAINAGYLRNLEPSRGRAFRLVLGDAPPASDHVLPSSKAVAKLYAKHRKDRSIG